MTGKTVKFSINRYTRGYQILVACCSKVEAETGVEANPEIKDSVIKDKRLANDYNYRDDWGH